MKAGDAKNRSSTFIPHPEADDYSKYLVTLLAQRRQLQTEGAQQLFDDSASTTTAPRTPASLFMVPATTLTIERERKDVQREVALPLATNPGAAPTTADRLRDEVLTAGQVLAGPSDTDMLLWHFRGRKAALAVERWELGRHMGALRRAHFAHVVTSTMPPGVAAARAHATLAHAKCQLNRAPAADGGGGCGCQDELELAAQCMAAVQQAETDAAARVARLEAAKTIGSAAAKSVVMDDDWEAALRHAVSTGPGGRLGQRLVDRLSVLPLSHHHRYPVYEQASAAALERDTAMAAAGLRVPPSVVKHISAAQGIVAGLLEGFPEAAGALDDQASAAGGARTEPTEAREAEAVEDDLGRHHRHLYVARKLLPRLMFHQSMRWPGATTHIDLHPPSGSGAHDGDTPPPHSAPASQSSKHAPGNSPYLSPTDLLQEPVLLEDYLTEELAAVAPSVEGDLSAGHSAAIRSVGVRTSEMLKAENAFLSCSDSAEASNRLRALAATHAARWSEEDPEATALTRLRSEGGALSTGGTLSMAAAQDALKPVHLDAKTLESLYTLRFLRTRRNRLRVLHFINAMVSLQASLMRDEALELDALEPLKTTASKIFTCPVRYSRGTAGDAGSGGQEDDGEALELVPDPSVAMLSAAGPSGRHSSSRRLSRATSLANSRVSRTSRISRFTRTTRRRQGAGLGVVGSGVQRGLMAQPSFMTTATSLHPDTVGTRPTLEAGVDASVQGDTLDSQEVYERDQWVEDDEAGVLVMRADGRCVVYRQSLVLFQAVEEELLRVASHHADVYAQQLHAAGRGHEAAELDWHGILEDIWTYEASFAAARHQLLLSYYSAYRHATDWGSLDMFAGQNHAGAPKPFPGAGDKPTVGDAWEGVAVNSPQPKLLGARQQLRREIVDLCFRRPNNCLDDGYFAGRHINETVSMELETALVSQLTTASYRLEREMLANACDAATAAAGAGPGIAELDLDGAVWRPGVWPGVVYGGVLRGGRPRGLWEEGALMSGVGAAAAALPCALRQIVHDLADVHQVRHYVEVAELRRVVLQSSVGEMSTLLREEAYRAHAPASKMPSDSRMRDGLGRPDTSDAAQAAALSWLVPSMVADNPVCLPALAAQAKCPPKLVLQWVLIKERIIRDLYRSEVNWLVYCTQSRALGRRCVASEMQGIDWNSLDSRGDTAKPELLKELVADCEPSDMAPPGAGGPPTAAGMASSTPQPGLGCAALPSVQVMVCVGRSGVLGGVWRQPPLALSEFSTHPAETLQVHSLVGVRSLLDDQGSGVVITKAAAQAQALHACSLEVAIRHNQVLLDFVIRKLDRRRRVLLWRNAAVEGMADDDVDVVVGAPPGSYRPSALTLTNQPPASAGRGARPEAVTPLLEDPPAPRAHRHRPARTMQASRGAPVGARQSGVLGSGQEASDEGDGGGMGMLDARGVADLRAARQQLVRAVAPLRVDLAAITLHLRQNVRREFVERVSANLDALRAGSMTGGGLGRSPGPTGDQSNVAAYGGGEMEAQKLEVFEEVYLRGWLSALSGPALRGDLAEVSRQLAVTVLGATGGYGHRWGLKWNTELRRLVTSPEPGPFFEGPEGANKLQKLLQDYGPLWQAIHFHLADKPDDPDPMDWQPLASGCLPPGLMVLDPNSDCVRLDQLWEFPCQVDLLALHHPFLDPVPQLPGSPLLRSPTHRERSGSPAPQQAAMAAAPGATPGAAVGASRDSRADIPAERASLAGASSLNRATSSVLRDKVVLQVIVPGSDASMSGAARPAWASRDLRVNERSALDAGVRLGRLLLQLLGHTVHHAAFLSAAAHLSGGGDVSRSAMLMPLQPQQSKAHATNSDHAQADGWNNPQHLTGDALLDHMGAVSRARVAPLLPGALMHPTLQALHSQLAYLVQPQGFVAGNSSKAPVPSTTCPSRPALDFLQRLVAVAGTSVFLGVVRARHTLAAGSGSAQRAWSTTVALEHTLAAALGHPLATQLAAMPYQLLQLGALRLPDAHRLTLHNEISKIQLLLDRAVSDCGIQQGVNPLAAVTVQEALVGHLWQHDRLRDALLHRAMLMEVPEQYPFPPAHQSHFLRRYHTLLIMPPCTPRALPSAARDWMAAYYTSRIMPQAQELVQAAQAALRAGVTHAEESVVQSPAGGSATAPGRPAWLALSSVWESPEGRAMEAACVVMKHAMDLQAIQVSMLRLHQDCAALTGMAAAQARRQSMQDADSDFGSVAYDRLLGGNASFGVRREQKPPSEAAGDVMGAAIQTLVRRLATNKQRVGPGEHPEGAADAFVVGQEELVRWLGEVVQCVGAEGRTRATTAADLARWERRHHSAAAEELEEQVEQLAGDHDVFMRRHAIRVETQIVDRAMELLGELGLERRNALRSLEDAKRAMEAAYAQAQAQHSAKISELQNALLVAGTNAAIQRADLQKAALQAMMEVRRETLQKAFGAGGRGLSTRPDSASSTQDSDKGATRGGIMDISHTLALESQIEELQTEIIDMQRAIIKVQTWFRMRSSAFQGICMREVVQARQRAAEAEGRRWEEKEAHELQAESLQLQLRATQADLEVAAATLAKSSADLTHALSSNKRLLAWKVGAQPRMAALQSSMQNLTRHKEAWYEWIKSKQGLMQRVSDVLLNVEYAKAQPKDGTGRASAAVREAEEEGRQLATDFADDVEVQALHDEIDRLRALLEVERAERAALKQGPLAAAETTGSPRPQTPASPGQVSASTKTPRTQAASLPWPGLPASTPAGNPAKPAASGQEAAVGAGGAAGLPAAALSGGPLAAVSAEVLVRRHGELQAAYQQERERSMQLARTLQAVRAVVPQVVAAFEPYNHSTSSSPLGSPVAASLMSAIPSRMGPTGRLHSGVAALWPPGSPRSSLSFPQASPPMGVQGTGAGSRAGLAQGDVQGIRQAQPQASAGPTTAGGTGQDTSRPSSPGLHSLGVPRQPVPWDTPAGAKLMQAAGISGWSTQEPAGASEPGSPGQVAGTMSGQRPATPKGGAAVRPASARSGQGAHGTVHRGAEASMQATRFGAAGHGARMAVSPSASPSEKAWLAGRMKPPTLTVNATAAPGAQQIASLKSTVAGGMP